MPWERARHKDPGQVIPLQPGKALHDSIPLANEYFRLLQLLFHHGGVGLPVCGRHKAVRLPVACQPDLHDPFEIAGLHVRAPCLFLLCLFAAVRKTGFLHLRLNT